MTKLQVKIAELESQVAEYSLTANLSAHRERRQYYTRLAQIVVERIEELRNQPEVR